MARKPRPTAPGPPPGAIPVRKLSRRDLGELDTRAFIETTRPAVRRLLGYVRPYRWRFFLGIFFGIVFAVFNAAVIFGLKFVFEMVLPSDKTSETLIIPLVGHFDVPKPKVDQGQSGWLLAATCGAVPLMILVRGLFGYLNSYYMLWVGQRVLNDLRTNTFSSLMRQSLRFYSKAKSGELIQTVFNQTRMVASAGSDLAANMVKHPLSILAIVVSLFVMDWVFAIASLLVFPLCMLPVMHIGRKVRKAGAQEESEAGAVMVTMQEAFAGIRIVKSHSREDYEIERFSKGSDMLERLVMRWRKAMELVGPLVETVASIGIAAGLAYAWYVQMPATKFLVLYAALIAIYPHAKSLSQLQIQLQKCLVAASKVFEIQDKEPDVPDQAGAIKLAGVRGAVEFEGISFCYKKGIRAVHGINLRLDPGKRYALVGQSGAGKSTLFSLLLRFYDPDQGVIRVDGHDIRGVTQQSLRDHIGVVNQDLFLFHDTIRNNIRYGKLDATDEELEDAARHAHAHDFILAQPHGYETVVGDKGSNLSGGQQQRIAIARAFVRNAPILLLDEATSALDSDAEMHIQAAIDDLSRGKTVIAIAHRLSTILSADAIVMMEKGKVVAVGRHDELLEACPPYRHLYQLQFESHLAAGDAAEAVSAPAQQTT